MQLRRTLLLGQPRNGKITYSENKVVDVKIFLAFSVELQKSFVSIIRKLLGKVQQVFVTCLPSKLPVGYKVCPLVAYN